MKFVTCQSSSTWYFFSSSPADLTRHHLLSHTNTHTHTLCSWHSESTMAGEEGTDNIADGQIQCTNHPYKNMINPGGICAFCLQDKLGKLVSSSFPIAVFPSSSPPSSSSAAAPAFRSNCNNSNSNPIQTIATHDNDYSSRRPRIPFLVTQRNKNKHLHNTSVSAVAVAGGLDFKRSKSTTTPGRSVNYDPDCESRKGFWSFLYYSKNRNINKRTAAAAAADSKPSNEIVHAPPSDSSIVVVVDENGSPQHVTSLGRKVSRSRSVGCGSRSFSGDLFERISTGFGDCTLRRVESQREGKAKSAGSRQDCIKERVKCGGIFSGFLVGSSSPEEEGKFPPATATVMGPLGNNGKNRSWGWPLASPIAYLSSSSSSTKRVESAGVVLNPTPSLTTVRG